MFIFNILWIRSLRKRADDFHKLSFFHKHTVCLSDMISAVFTCLIWRVQYLEVARPFRHCRKLTRIKITWMPPFTIVLIAYCDSATRPAEVNKSKKKVDLCTIRQLVYERMAKGGEIENKILSSWWVTMTFCLALKCTQSWGARRHPSVAQAESSQSSSIDRKLLNLMNSVEVANSQLPYTDAYLIRYY